MNIKIEPIDNRSSPIGELFEDVKPNIHKIIKEEIKTPSPKKLIVTTKTYDPFPLNQTCAEGNNSRITSIPRVRRWETKFKQTKPICYEYLRGKCQLGRKRCSKHHPYSRYPTEDRYNEALVPKNPQSCLRPKLPHHLPHPSKNRTLMPNVYRA